VVAIRLRRPSPDAIADLVNGCAADHLTYEPVGISLGTTVPAGFRRQRWSVELHGAQAFDRAVAAIRGWEVHRGSGLAVVADGSLAVGTNVIITAPLPIGCVDVVCRIVAVIDEADRFGFAYGTLSVHPEQGEEAFVVSRSLDGSVTFFVEAVSRSAFRLGRLVPFVTDQLQDQANNRYLRAMERAVAN
jgi:uncharacterized protein (UPF0548 family)